MEVYLHQLSLILEANTTIGKESDAISNLQTLQRTLKTELIIPFSSQFSPKIIETIFSTILSLSYKEYSSSNQNHISYSNTNQDNQTNTFLSNYSKMSFQDALHHFLNHVASLMKSFCPSTLLMILTNLSQTEKQKEENNVMVVWISQLIPILQLNDLLTIQLCEKLIEFCPKKYLLDIPDSFWVLLREKLEKEDHLNILKNGLDLSDPNFSKQASILCQKYPNDTISYIIQKGSMKFISSFLSYLPPSIIFDTLSLNARISDAINLDGDFDEMIYSLQALPYLIERLSYAEKERQKGKSEKNDIYDSDEITALKPVWKGILRQLKSLSSSNVIQNFDGSRTFFIDTLLYGESRGFVAFDEILPFIDLDNDDIDPLLLTAYLNVIFNDHLDNEYIQTKVMSFLKMIISLSSIDHVDDEVHCKPLNVMLFFINKKENFEELMKINQSEFLSIIRMLFNTNAAAFTKKSIVCNQIRFILDHFDVINSKMNFIDLNRFVRNLIEISSSGSFINDEKFDLLLKLIQKVDNKISFDQLDWFSNSSLIHRNFKLLQLMNLPIDSNFVFELLSSHLIDVNDISEPLKIILDNAKLDVESDSNEIARNRKILSASVRIAMNYFSRCIEIIGFDINEELRKYNLNIRTNTSNSNSNDSSSSSSSFIVAQEISWFEPNLLENLFWDIQSEFEFSIFGRFLAVITEFIYQGRKAAKLSQNAKILFIIYCRFLGSLIPVSSSHLLTGLIHDFKEEFSKSDKGATNENMTSIVSSNKKQFFELYFPHTHFDAIVDAATSLFGIEETYVMYRELVSHSITYSYPIAEKFAPVLQQPLPKLATFLAFIGVEKHKKWLEDCMKSIPFKKWIIRNNCYDGYIEGCSQNVGFNSVRTSYLADIKKKLSDGKETDFSNLKELFSEFQKIDIDNYKDDAELLATLDSDHIELLDSIRSIFSESSNSDEESVGADELSNQHERQFSLSFNKEEFIESQKSEVPFKFNEYEPSSIANLISFFWHSYTLSQSKESSEESVDSFGIGCSVSIADVEKFVLENTNNAKLVLGFLSYAQRFDNFSIDIEKWTSSLRFLEINSRNREDHYYVYSSALIIDSMTKKVNEMIFEKREQIESNEKITFKNNYNLSPLDLVPETWMNFIKDSLEFIGVYNAKSLVTLFFKKNGYSHLLIRSLFRLFGLISSFLEVASTAVETSSSLLISNAPNDTAENARKVIGSMLSCERIAGQINRENISLGIAEVILTIPSPLANVTYYLRESKKDNESDKNEKLKKAQSAIEFERLVNLAKSVASDTKQHYDHLLKTCLNTINGRTTVDMYCEIVSTLSSTLFSKTGGRHKEGPKINIRKSGSNLNDDFDYDLNSMECYRLIPTNYQHNQCLLSFGEKLQNIQSGNTVLVPSTFIQTLLSKLDKELVVTREFFILAFNFALNTENYLHICQLMENKFPCSQDHLRTHFNQEEVYKNFFNCKPPSFLRGVFRTFLSKFTIFDSKQMKQDVSKIKQTAGLNRIHPALCYVGSKKVGMKPWKNSHFPNLQTLLSIGYVDLKTVMRNFTEIGTSPIEIFNTFTSLPAKEIEEVHAWPSAQDAKEDFAIAIFNMTVNTLVGQPDKKQSQQSSSDKNKESTENKEGNENEENKKESAEENQNENNDQENQNENKDENNDQENKDKNENEASNDAPKQDSDLASSLKNAVLTSSTESINGEQSVFGNDCHYYDDFGIARQFYFNRDYVFAKRVSEVLLQRIPIEIVSKMLFDVEVVTHRKLCNNPVNAAIIANRILLMAKKTCRENIVDDFSKLIESLQNKPERKNKNKSVVDFLKNMNDLGSLSKLIHLQ